VSKVFVYRDLAVRAECDRDEPLQWLSEFLSPAFDVRDHGPADCTVSLIADRREFDATRARGPRADATRTGCFALDSGLTMLPRWNAPADELVLYDAEVDLFYDISADRSRIRILAARERPARRIGLMRVVRELALSRAWSATSMVTHAAALAVGDTGIVIAGSKRAGKTSLLMQLLLSSRPDVAFVANDRVVIDVDADVALRGMPTIVTIRPPSADTLPALHRRLAPARGDHRLTMRELAESNAPVRKSVASLQCTPAQLCALLDVPMQAQTRPAVLLLPQVCADTTGADLMQLSPSAAAARLRTLYLGGDRPALSQAFNLPARPGGLDRTALDALCETVAQRVLTFACRLGRDADRPGVARGLLDRLVATSAATHSPARAMAR
jgi:hypothetical protein